MDYIHKALFGTYYDHQRNKNRKVVDRNL